LQTRSFLHVTECVEAVIKLMQSNYNRPVNIGSEEMVTINQLAEMAINISGKDLSVKNIYGDEFEKKYGFKCPVGVRGRNSDNRLYKEKVGWEVKKPLIDGMRDTYSWINNQLDNE
jgi:nucleoside-diphosphate-sugar epimerase